MKRTIMWSEWELIDWCEKLEMVCQKGRSPGKLKKRGVIPYLEETGCQPSWRIEEKQLCMLPLVIHSIILIVLPLSC